MLIFKHIFKAIQNKVNNDIKTIRLIDLWNEELDLYREEMPIIFPSVFIEFLPTTWNTIGSSNSTTQHGYTTIKIHVAQYIITETSSIDGNDISTQTDALKRFDLLQEVQNTLQNFTTIDFKKLERITTYIDHNHNGIIEDVIEYRTILTDQMQNVNSPYNQPFTLPDVGFTN